MKKEQTKALAKVTNETGLATEAAASAALALRHGEQIHKLGEIVLNKIVESGIATYNLCKYIRDNQVAPTLVSAQLKELGFSKGWASQVNSVALAGDDVWNEFAAKTMTFKDVLQLKQGLVPKAIADATGADVTDVKAQIEEMDAEEEHNPDLVPPTAAEIKAKIKADVQKALARLVKCFVASKSKKLDLTIDQVRITVVLTKAKKAKEAAPEVVKQ